MHLVMEGLQRGAGLRKSVASSARCLEDMGPRLVSWSDSPEDKLDRKRRTVRMSRNHLHALTTAALKGSTLLLPYRLPESPVFIFSFSSL